MKTYKVETYSKASKSFEGAATFKPEYIMSVMTFKKYWWFPWIKVEYGVITNLREAEKEALKKAKAHARLAFHQVQCQIIEETVVNGQKTKETVWQNGKALGKDKWPLWYRAWCWLWRF